MVLSPTDCGGRPGATSSGRHLHVCGQITAARKPRDRHQQCLPFLKQVARAHRDQDLHLVMEKYATHKRVEIRDWLAANPRIHVHFTPTLNRTAAPRDPPAHPGSGSTPRHPDPPLTRPSQDFHEGRRLGIG